MILGPAVSETDGDVLSTCSVTLIDNDQIIFAGHCFDSDEEALGSSVTSDYQTDRAGNRLPGYNPKFIKVTKVLDHKFDKNDPQAGDWVRLQLASSPPGIPPIQMRADLPSVSPPEQVSRSTIRTAR
jgi:V8-like Glu-specific endopeptidase